MTKGLIFIYLFIIAWSIIILIRKFKKLEQEKKYTIKLDIAAQKHAELDEENKYLKSENQELVLKNKELEKEINKFENDIEYLKDKLEQKKQAISDELKVYKDNELKPIFEKIKIEQGKLDTLKKIQTAYIKEQQRREEILAQKDYYRLVISEDGLSDIQQLRKIQYIFHKKDVIDKIIWDNYYKPAFDVLCSHVLKTNDKVCGIYKITSLTSGKSYIGQSVDIKSRWKDHIKAGISSESTSNKFYLHMKKYSPSDFIFEVLEQVDRSELNNRETYYIDFYQTKDQLNSTRGGS